MSQKQIIKWYMVGTFFVTYFMWGIIIFANQSGYMKFGTVLFWCFYAMGGLASTTMGVALSLKAKRVDNFKSLLKEVITVKQPIKYYGVMFLFFILSFGIPALSGSLQSSLKWYWGVFFIFKMILFGGLEEIGWRYTFQPALEQYFSFWVSSSITAILWSLWHLPLFFMDGMNKGMNYWLFVINVFGMSFMLGAIYRISQSIWLCILFHAMINAFSQVWTTGDNMQNPIILTLILTILKVVISIIIITIHSSYVKNAELSTL